MIIDVRGVTLVAIVLLAGSAAAATFDVNLTVDEPDFDPGDGVCRASITMGCSLRAAIEEANALAGYDVINLPAGTFTLTITGTGEDDAATGDLDVWETLSIYGAGMDSTHIDAAGIDRVFDLHTGVLQLVGLTVSGGRATTSTSSVGGGISAYGSILSIGGCRLTDNIANQGGAIYTSFGTTLQIADSLLDANQTQDLGFKNQYGPAISALGGLSLESSTVTGNVAEWGQSFAVHVQCIAGSVLILNSTIAENSSSADLYLQLRYHPSPRHPHRQRGLRHHAELVRQHRYSRCPQLDHRRQRPRLQFVDRRDRHF